MLSRVAIHVPRAAAGSLFRTPVLAVRPLPLASSRSATTEAKKGKSKSADEEKIEKFFGREYITGDPNYVLRPIGVTSEELYQPSDNYPSKTKKAPERDLVNFPDVRMQEKPPETKMVIVPKSWCDLLSTKTGVSGPYVFVGGLVTFLVSKEWYVIEHEFWNALSLGAIMYYVCTRFKEPIYKFLNDKRDYEWQKVQFIHEKLISNLEEAVQSEKHAQWQAEGQGQLFVAKKENVALQLEAAFRQRQMQVFNEVKRRLDYQVELQNAEGRIKHQHMVNWIVAQVNKALTPELEKATLQQCIKDLKGLAATA